MKTKLNFGRMLSFMNLTMNGLELVVEQVSQFQNRNKEVLICGVVWTGWLMESFERVAIKLFLIICSFMVEFGSSVEQWFL
jgi:hypothetical protein